MRKNDINFIEVYKAQGKEKAESNSPAKIYLVIFLVTALILGSFTIKLLLDRRTLEREIASLEDYINNPQRQQKLAEITKMQADISRLDEMEEELANLNTVLDVIPRFDRRVLNVIALNKPSNVEIQSILYDGEWVQVDVTGTTVMAMSNYTLELKRSNVFEDVYYTGYSAADGVYDGTIFVALKGIEVASDE